VNGYYLPVTSGPTRGDAPRGEETGIATSTDPLELRYITVHGYVRAYRMAGSGPALLLIHGLGCDSSTWLPVMAKLARRYTVIAPDLLGHGASDKPRADYTLGGYANAMRDLLTLLGVDRVTVVGHSFGGGVAMQFAYQFPERTERMLMIAPGGLGREVTPFVRMLTLPFAATGVVAATLPPLRPLVRGSLRLLSRTGLPHTRDLGEVAKVYSLMCDRGGREAVTRVAHTVIDWRGQIVRMTDRAYLTALLPVCVIWGTEDDVVPVSHAAIVEAHAPGAQVHVFADCGHFPHREQPDRFIRVVNRFIASTEPATYHRGRWRALMRRGADAPELAVITPAEAPQAARARGADGGRAS
jgi:pimeloyl-ACP methyl ester carboxylesterase